MTTKGKSQYLADVISENSINTILYIVLPPVVPKFTSVKALCDHFPKYFFAKIETISSKIYPDKVQNIPSVDKPEIIYKMNVFERVRQKMKLKAYFELIVKIM